ncbi:hypothetical protein HHI36_008698, partial [Cryptolaemus montrouzieri]
TECVNENVNPNYVTLPNPDGKDDDNLTKIAGNKTTDLQNVSLHPRRKVYNYK